jgi:BirA family transcriptional regulator, biotin operon repressor / biotin---[acetyl-CoA-carboxylase] ligase
VQQRRFEHGVTDSTSERAFAAIAAGTAEHGDVHTASAQTKGRGRLGRVWHSAPGEGLYASVVLLPQEPWNAAALTMAAGLAALDAVCAVGLGDPLRSTRRARLDWPNDVVVPRSDGRTDKLAGVLAETRGLDPRAPHYVLGIGINVAQHTFPAELLAERGVTSLRLCGIDTDVPSVLEALLRALPRRLEASERHTGELGREFLAATELAGARVAVDAGAGSIVGHIEELSVPRGLSLRADTGRIQTLPLELVRAVDRA